MLVFLAIRAERADMRIPGLTGTILLFVPIFAAFTVFTYMKVFLFGGMIQAFMLIGLLLCAVQFPFGLEDAAGADKQTGIEPGDSLPQRREAIGDW
jgi:hypothetical protein